MACRLMVRRATRTMRAVFAAALTATIVVAVLGAGVPGVAAQTGDGGSRSEQGSDLDVTEGLEPGTLEGDGQLGPAIGGAASVSGLAYPNLGASLSALAVAAAPHVPGDGATGNSSDTGDYAVSMIGLSITFDGDPERVVEAIAAIGGDVRNVFDSYIEAFVPPAALAVLAQIPGLTWAREFAEPHEDRGRHTSGGVAAHLADAWHGAGITGAGVKIGVIDGSLGPTARDGFSGLRSAMASGDLPAAVVGRCYKAVALATGDIDDCARAGGNGHGLAVAATVMDVAPDASLYISNPFTWGDLQRSVEWMKDQGVGVIVYSMSWSYHGAADGTSPVSPSPLNTVKWAADNGIVWVNSAGNYNGASWFGAFTDADNDNIHEWATGDEYQEFTLNAGETKPAVFMRWDDAWGGASKDLALLVVKNPGTAQEQVVDNLNDEQKGGSNSFPFEFKEFTAPHTGTYAFVVKKVSGATPGWIQMGTFGSLAHTTVGHSLLSPADSPHTGMLAVGAAPDTRSIRSYSSRGPTPDGRVKPDIVGADGYVALDGANYGTSYAAPHVAGLAALVRQQNPSFSPAQTTEYLKAHAVPRGYPDPNNTWGHGFAQLPPFGCVDRLLGDGTVSGAWTSSCTSAVHAQKSSRYYTFTIAQQSTVTIDLSSSVDSYLYLRNGYNNQKGVVLHEDDDSGTGTDARISESLAVGTYTIEATTASTGQTGAFTLAASGGLTEMLEVSIAAGGDITEGGDAIFTLTATPAPPTALTARVEITADGDWGVAPGTRTVTIPTGGSATLTLATYKDSTEEYDGSVTARLLSDPAYHVHASAPSVTVQVSDSDGGDPDSCFRHLTVDGSYGGSWSSDCASRERSSTNARFYTFRLTERSTVTIELKSSKDSFLYLRRGQRVLRGQALHENDDSPHRGLYGTPGSYDAFIRESLSAGWYTIEATTLRRRKSGSFTLDVSGLGTAAAVPEVSIAAGADVTEGGSATFTVSAVPVPSADLDVTVAVSQVGDFGVIPGSRTVTVPATGSAVLSVATVGDSVGEFDGTVTARVADGAGYAVSSSAGAGTVVVSDDDGDPPCSVRLSGNGSVAGKWSSGCASVFRSGPYARFYSFNLSQQSAVTIELASFEDNYLNLRAGQDARTGVPLHHNDDYRSPGTDAGISETLAAGWYTIEATTRDRAVSGDFVLAVSGLTAQPAGPEVSIAAGSGVTEGGVAVFTVSAVPAPAAALDVSVAVTASGDFGVSPGSRTVTVPTSGSVTLTVSTTDDSTDESDGSVTATVDAGTGYRVSATAGSASVAVADDDDPPCDVAAAISRARAGYAWHSDNDGGSETWFWQILAYLGADPMPAPPGGIAPASTSPEAVSAFSDGKPWSGWAPINAAMGCHVPPPEVSIIAGSDIGEGGDAVFTVTAVPAPAAALDVAVVVSQSGDFGVSPGSRTVTVPTSGTATLTVATVADSADEADGSVTATVGAGTGYRVSATAGSASVAVADDDVPEVSIAAGSDIDEGGDAVFTVSAVPAPAAALDVTVAVTAAGDFGVAVGPRTVTVPASGTATLTVATTGDSTDEADGSVTVAVGAGVGYTVSATAGSASVAVADDDDPPPVTPEVSITAGSGIGEGGDAVFTVSASPAPAAALDVTVTVTQSGDFGAATGSRQVTIPATGSAAVTVATTGDSIDEADGSVTATVNTGSGYTVSAASGSATVAVADDDDPPPVPVDECVSVLSGDGSVAGVWAGGCASSARSGRYALFYSFSLDSASTVRVDLVSSADTYMYLRRGLGQRSGAWLEFDDDDGDGYNSRISRRLGAGGYTIEATTYYPSAAGAFTLTVDGIGAQTVPQPDPVVSITAGSGIGEGGNAVFTVSASPAPAAAFDVTVAVTAAGDFGVTPGTHTVTVPTSGSVTLTVATTDDSTDEADGSVTATVGAGSGYTVSPTAGSVTVAVSDDDDAAPVVCVPSLPTDAVTVSEVTGWRDAHSGAAHVLRWDRVLAALGVDNGEAAMTVEQSRANEGLFMFGRWDRVTRTLEALEQCDDPPPATPEVGVTAGGGVTEGGDAVFTVTADPAPSSPLSVEVTVAQSGDYGAATGTRTVTVPVSGSVTLRVATTNDSVDEADGSVNVNVNSGTGYAVSQTAGAATVAVSDDDDPAPPPPDPQVSIAAGADVVEGGDAVFTVTAVPAPSSPLSVGVSVAQAGDYGAATGTQTVTVPTSGSVTLTISTTNDSTDEADGTITATVGAGSGYTVSATAGAASVGVADDDDPPPPLSKPSITVGDASAGEGDGAVTFTVELSGPAAATVRVTYWTRSYTAISGVDFPVTYGWLTFAAGETAKTVRVPLIDDTVSEAAETFQLRLLMYDTTHATLADDHAQGTITDND